MNNEKELENTVIDKITEVMDTYNVEYLLLRSNVTGDLKDYLKALDDEQLDIVARCYYTEEEIKEKSFSKLRELLDNKIKEKFMEIILPMPYSQYKNIEALARDEKIERIANIFIYAGIVYGCVNEDDEVFYVLPNDIKKLYLENITKEDKVVALKGELTSKLFSMLFSMGLVGEDFVLSDYDDFDNLVTKEELLDEWKELIDIKVINNQRYFWLKSFPYNDEYANNIENRKYIKRNDRDYGTYMFSIMEFIDSLSKIMKKPYKETLSITISKILSRQRDFIEIANDIEDSFKLNKSNKIEMKDLIGDIYSEIRFWDNGGNTVDEEKIDILLLKSKPKKNTLTECLKNLTKEGLDELCYTYSLDNNISLDEIIVESFNEEASYYFYNYSELEELISLDNRIYNGNDNITSFIINGYAYIYKENDDIKVLIPKEIKEILRNLDIDSLDIDADNVIYMPNEEDYVSAYMTYNGIIYKTELQRLLKENHDFDVPIEELDEIINDLEMVIGDDYYSLFESDNLLEELVLPNKSRFKKYKIVDINDFTGLDALESLDIDIRKYLNSINIKNSKINEIEANISILINTNIYSEEGLKSLLEDMNINLTKNNFKELTSIINKYKNDIPIWVFNGYTKKEVNSIPREKKIGRNDSCPCGSGKKYKKCCGRNK